MFQVVIAMSGFGERFRRAGYTIPKPLIEVHGRPIIGHVVDMFPGINDIIFICNQDHLDEPSFRMRDILTELCPGCQIVGIPAHKLGPVHAVLKVREVINPERPTIINYCDFTCYWDFDDFQSFVVQSDCDGAIPAYTGFHPHMLGSTNYAYVREKGGWVKDIQEKQPYTDTPMEEYASSGTYYFRTGALALEYCQKTIDEGTTLNGEYYVSLVYKPLLQDGYWVAVYPIQHFMQWGTPIDLAEYQHWAKIFYRLLQYEGPPAMQEGALLMPMAGAGSRFRKAGYVLPKPLIPVNGKPMAVQAALDLPAANLVFVLRQDLDRLDVIKAVMLQDFPIASTVVLNELTDGQARTCLLATDGMDPSAPLTIGACDNGILYDHSAFEALMTNPEVDVIVWGVREHPNAARNPHMYGWIDAQDGQVKQVSVKTPLPKDTTDQQVIIGAFTFKRTEDFRCAAEQLISKDAQINGEYYVDSCINEAIELGLRCAVFTVDAYLCWGTPEELRSYEYWQSCFHKWPGHIYQLKNDPRISASARAELEARFAPFTPMLPEPGKC